MLRSMTGFGQAQCVEKGWGCVVTLRSVNSRFLDVRFRLPAWLAFLEDQLLRIMRTRLYRGRVDANFTLWPESVQVMPGLNEATLQIATAWIKQGRDVLGSEVQVGFGDLLKLQEQWGHQEVPVGIEVLAERTLRQALDILMDSRKREGEALEAQLGESLDNLDKGCVQLSKLARQAPQRLTERMQQLLRRVEGGALVNEERLAQEIALLARRVDVSEELERLGHHLREARQLMTDSNPTPGRRLEFLLQELQRELNTLSAKSEDSKAIDCVLLLKIDLEKMREQVQNLE